nr:hypothetical protein [Tanacetum cinerariifolium]
MAHALQFLASVISQSFLAFGDILELHRKFIELFGCVNRIFKLEEFLEVAQSDGNTDTSSTLAELHKDSDNAEKSLLLTGQVVVPAGRVIVPTGRVIVPTCRVVVPTGRVVVPTGRVVVLTGRYIVPTGRVVVPTGRVVVPAGRVIVPTGRVVVPTCRVVVPTGRVVVPTECLENRVKTVKVKMKWTLMEMIR